MIDVIKSLSFKARQEQWLEAIVKNLDQELGLTPCVGIELEFYLSDDNIASSPIPIKNERGKSQYEATLTPSCNPSLAILDLEKSINLLTEWRSDVNFHPKPFPQDYGNALQFHVNFLKDGHNYYDNRDNLEAGAMALCHFLKPTFLVFAPEESHYARLNGQMMAPTHVSYGGNNRTTSIRIPEAKPRRLEHRVSSPMTDAYLALSTILYSLYLGIKNPTTIQQYKKIYGNAHDEQYDLELLPQSLQEAKKGFDKKNK